MKEQMLDGHSELNQFTSEWSDPEKVLEEMQLDKLNNSSNSNIESEKYVAPRTPTEVKVAEIWSKFLGIKKIGVFDGFTKLGGHSLMVMEILARVQEVFNVQIPMATFFSETDFTVAELSKIIDEYQINQANDNELDLLVKEMENLSDEEIKQLLKNEM